jgi:hypothetical protein
VWGNDVAESRVMRARLRYSSPEAGNIDASGKPKAAKRETTKSLPPPMDL